jgi:nitric oxide dioxygenase
MLTPEQTAIIKATVPLLETGGEALTKHFYKIMLGEYAEVRPLFNQAHQASGSQPRALANSVLQYARHIDNLGALGNLPAQIIQKHVSLQIQPEHYPIVGTCLLRAIREVLGAEIATDAVIEAWGAAYWQLANILIGAEKTQYDQQADAPGGWRGARQFRVARKVAESQEVRRNYSLSRAANGRNLRISVKRERGVWCPTSCTTAFLKAMCWRFSRPPVNSRSSLAHCRWRSSAAVSALRRCWPWPRRRSPTVCAT